MEHFFKMICQPTGAFIALLAMGCCIVYLMKDYFADFDDK